MNHKHIIKSLPLLASILGRKYGVRVQIGGDQAYTNGNLIQLPALPLDCSDNFLGLVRGFLDHEAAHIRETDFTSLKAAKLEPLEKHIWNIIEDYRVEKALADIYPGCRGNFHWLIKHLFLSPDGTGQAGQAGQAGQTNPAEQILEWLLVTLRSWSVPELAAQRDALEVTTEKHYPGLSHELESVLQQVAHNCFSTAAAIALAREITEVISKYAQCKAAQPGDSQSNQSGAGVLADDDNKGTDSTGALNALQQLLAVGGSGFNGDIGEKLKGELLAACSQGRDCICVATVTGKPVCNLDQKELNRARQATTALRTSLQSLLQSARAVRNRSGYAGKLNLHRLHSIATGNARLFLRRGEQAGMNTAVHILVDTSGSMCGPSIELAGQACFAVASALSGIKGIGVSVTAFPGNRLSDQSGQSGSWDTVAPILRHNEKLHTAFDMQANGNTPLDSALWWVLQQMHPLPEPRKIIILLTDGAPDDRQLALEAIRAGKGLGFEIYGIGILDSNIKSLLPYEEMRVINSLDELAPAMFAMLQKALLAGQHAN